MSKFAWMHGSALLLFFLTSSSPAQTRSEDGVGSTVATAIPIVRVTMQNPREINLGKAATFVVGVTNQGKSPATEVVVATNIPEHVDLAKAVPEPIEVDGRTAKFWIGDLAPGTTRHVTLVAIPRTTDPIKLHATTTFGASTKVLVRQPVLQLTAQVAPKAEIATEVDWLVRVTNTGDGLADDVVITPNLVEGQVQGSPLLQTVKIGPLKPGETKEVQFTVVPIHRGRVAVRFEGSSADGLSVSEESAFQVLQADLAVVAKGPTVQPLAREGTYEIRVTNPGDATTGSTMVYVKIPPGLEVTAAAENAYDDSTRTLRWRITKVRPSDVVRLPFRAETTGEGAQTLKVIARSEQIDEATTTHTTTVISRPNLIVTVVNDQELSAVGDPIGFKITMINAGSKPAKDLRVRVSMPEGMKAVGSDDYQVKDEQIEFPLQKLASGEKVTLTFLTVGSQVGEHRVRVLVSGRALTRELSFEGSTYCYSNDDELSVRRTKQGDSPNDA